MAVSARGNDALPPGGHADSAAPSNPWDRYTERQRLLYLLVLSLISTSNFVDRNIVGLLLQPIKAEFGASDTQLGLLTGISFALFYAVLGLPIARFADRGDRVRLINVALLVWSGMTVLCGFAQGFWQLALARVGVGAGEAGAVPPAQSLLADYFPPERRAFALAVFTLAATAGYLFGFAGGGWIAQTYGWRATFVIVGLPGVLLALLAGTVLPEPRRGKAASAVPVVESLVVTARALLRKPAFVWVLASMVLYYFLSYGALIFTTTFIVRVHGLSLAQAGLIFGLVAAGAAVTGSLAGGWLADRVMRDDPRLLCRLCAVGLFLALPLHVLAFTTGSLPVLFVALFVAVSVLSAVIPSQYAALHRVCGSARRATAIAFALFVINLLGMGLGPIATGLISDHLAGTLGSAEGLRWALLSMLVVFIPAALCMLAAQSHLARDTEA